MACRNAGAGQADQDCKPAVTLSAPPIRVVQKTRQKHNTQRDESDALENTKWAGVKPLDMLKI